jgi:hypothetical protein
VVYLTECGVDTAPGSMLDAEIVQASGYDLVGRPLSPAQGLCYPN